MCLIILKFDAKISLLFVSESIKNSCGFVSQSLMALRAALVSK